jgi:hypothetical protein
MVRRESLVVIRMVTKYRPGSRTSAWAGWLTACTGGVATVAEAAWCDAPHPVSNVAVDSPTTQTAADRVRGCLIGGL